MKNHSRWTLVLAAILITAGIGAAGRRDDDDCKRKPKTIPFDGIDFFFELNETDEDLGVQLMLDAEPWKRLQIFDPYGTKILDTKGKDSLKEFGLASFFFESNEPNFDEIGKDDILDLFPEGDYIFKGTTIEGDRLKGSATLTHDLPDGPEITSPEEDEVVDPDEVVVKWKPVVSPSGISITSYQVIVTNDEDSRFVYDVRVPADATSISVPPGFLQSDTEYELEVLAVEKSGNQTISLIFFTTE